MRKISLVVWRDAKTDPPEWDGMYQSDVGFSHYHAGRWRTISRDEPKPLVWCDPTPPGDDALTLDDLRALERMASYAVVENDFDGDGNPTMAGLWNRLRRALEEAEGA